MLNSEKNGRKVPMARVKSAANRSLFSSLNLNKSGLYGAVFLVTAGIGWVVMSLIQEPETVVSWQSCLIEEQDGSLYPVMEQIPAGVYELPVSVIGNSRGMSAEITAPFLVQSEEVTLQQFKKYAKYIESLPAGEEKDRLMVRLGVQWQKGENPSSSIKAISWEGAWDYTRWLGQKTGCFYDIPSQDEWVATVSHLQSRDDIRLDSTVPPTGPLKNLLWGVREWSRSRCASGYYLLGRDDLTASSIEEQASCMPAMFSIAGFRLVMNPASATNSVAVEK
jgi:hypothetical protein